MKNFISFTNKNKSFTIFLVLSILLILFSLIAPYIAPNDPLQTNLAKALQGPSTMYPIGTDQLGRCLWSRILYGMGNSFKMTFYLLAIVFTFGTIVGILSGYFGGLVDTIIMRVSDVFLAFPGLVFAIAIAGILGSSLINTVLALALVNWTKYARVSRSLVMSVREKDYIMAAKIGGARKYQIILKYILPNIISPLIVLVALDIGTMLLEISALSFLGLAAQPPNPEWGYMLSEGRNFIQTAPWLMIYPGLAIFITVMIFNLVGDTIRDMLDPNKDY